MYTLFQPLLLTLKALGSPTLEGMLLARHRCLDHLLAAAIEDGRVSTVVELAAGLSPRGWDFKRRFGDRLHYIEVDLPGMVQRKSLLLEGLQSTYEGEDIEVVPCNVFSPGAVEALLETLDKTKGLAVVSEGLVNYFPTEEVEALWQGVARGLKSFKHGVYLSDLKLGSANEGKHAQSMMLAISVLVKSTVHTHFASMTEARESLRAAGFLEPNIRDSEDTLRSTGQAASPGSEAVKIIEAWV
jgi:O-methyltransferase involved in polyketide biosynthesis